MAPPLRRIFYLRHKIFLPTGIVAVAIIESYSAILYAQSYVRVARLPIRFTSFWMWLWWFANVLKDDCVSRNVRNNSLFPAPNWVGNTVFNLSLSSLHSYSFIHTNQMWWLKCTDTVYVYFIIVNQILT